MVPSAAIVAGPRGGVALRARIGRASEHEGAFAGLQFQQAFVSRAGVFHAEDVVGGAVVDGRAVIEAVYRAEGHGLVGTKEDRRLIHVVPEAGGAHGDEILVEAAPPVAHAREREIGENAVPGPYLANINRAIGIFDERIILGPRVVRHVAVVGVFLDVQVGDQDRVKALGAKIRNHFLEGGKVFAIDGEGGIALLIVNVQVDDIGGDFLVAQSFHNFADARLGIIAIAALLVTERPERGQRRSAGHGRVLLDDFFRFGTGDEVVVQLTAFSAKRKVVSRLFAEVERTAVSIVEENAVRDAFPQADKERDGFVERVGRFLPAKFIRVPVGEGAVAAVHGAGFVAETIVVLIGRHFFPDVNPWTIPGHGQAGLVGEQHVSGSIGKRDEQRRFCNGHMDGTRDHLYFIFFVMDLNGTTDVVQRRLGQSPREIFWKMSSGSDTDANHAVVKLRNANLSLTGCQLHAVLQTLFERFDAFHFTDVLPALSNAACASQGANQQPHSYASNE